MIVPVIFLIIGLAILKAVPSNQELPSLTLNLDKFTTVFVPYSTPTDGTTLTLAQKSLVDSFVNFINSRSKTSAVQTNTLGNSSNDYLKSKSMEDVFIYTQQYIGALDFTVTNSTLQLLAYFNNEAYHTPAIMQNIISNALLNYVTNGKMGQLITVNHPMPQTTNDKLDNSSGQSTLAIVVAINLLFGISFLAGSISVYIIKERSSRAKHLQFLSGVMSLTYWLSNFIWDVINFLLPIFLILIALAAFQIPAYVNDNRLGIVFLLMLFFSFSIIPMMYLLSYLFDVPSLGLTWLTIINILFGSLTVIVVGILRLPILDLVNVSNALHWVFLVISPNYCLGQGFSNIYVNYLYLNSCRTDAINAICARNISHPCCPLTCGSDCLEMNDDYMGWKANGIGQMLTFLIIQFVVFTSLVCFTETSLFNRLRGALCSFSCRCCCRASKKTNDDDDDGEVNAENPALLEDAPEDDDVAAERKKVNAADEEQLKVNSSLVLKELGKSYGSFQAVDGLCCTVAPSNCFGLLGVNGAGKTTTFKMLTGDIDMTAGEVYINGFDLRKEQREAQSTMGYCPQFDALIDELTGREVLTLYARLRGIREEFINKEAERLMKLLQLMKYADYECGRYSGGNKRKLSTAIALIGSPKLICLDEPTTGMDPVSRRHLWDTLTRYRNLGNTLVLTSHSMEECEALCTSIAIMVNGKFQCLGTCQHLKAKFAEGYTVLIQIPYPNETEGQANLQKLMDFIKQNVNRYEVKDQHQGHIHLSFLKTPNMTWSNVFGLMQTNRQRLGIVHYSVTQTSLEQVFLGFARKQKPVTQ
jgi:ATP-binding cassette, subfamily A (ABC1), member 3